MRSKIDLNVLYSETTKVLTSDLNISKSIYELDVSINKNKYTIRIVLGMEKVKNKSIKYVPIYIVKENPEIIGVFEYTESVDILSKQVQPIFFNRINETYLNKYKINNV